MLEAAQRLANDGANIGHPTRAKRTSHATRLTYLYIYVSQTTQCSRMQFLCVVVATNVVVSK
jgi:hypothetical protein